MHQIDAEHCTRERVVINDENYYFISGEGFIHATVPYENRPERLQERLQIDNFCNTFEEGMIVKVLKSNRSLGLKEGEIYKAVAKEEKILLESRIPDGFSPMCTQERENVKILIERVK